MKTDNILTRTPGFGLNFAPSCEQVANARPPSFLRGEGGGEGRRVKTFSSIIPSPYAFTRKRLFFSELFCLLFKAVNYFIQFKFGRSVFLDIDKIQDAGSHLKATCKE